MKILHKRRLVALTTTFLLTFSAIPTSVVTVFAESNNDYRLGDVNVDGAVNSLDSMLVLQGGLSAQNKLAADVNQDSLVNDADADLILEYRVGTSPVFTKATISVNPASLSFTTVGQTAAVTPTVQHGSGNMLTNITWKMENENIAVYSNGVVTAKKSGSTNLTATLLNGQKFVCPIVVSTSEKERYFGIDVSSHQNTINWDQVSKSPLYNYTWNGDMQNPLSYKADKLSDTIDFAILRAGYGRYKEPDGSINLHQIDSQFKANYNAAKSVGMPIGVYHFSYANTPDDARNEAILCLNAIQGRSFEYPIFFDVEHSSMLTKPNGAPNSKAEMNAIVNAFCTEIRNAGYYPALYSGKNFILNNLDITTLNYDLWVAQYWEGGYKPSGSSWEETHSRSNMWQYSAYTKGVDGIPSTFLDTDVSYVNYPKIIAASGLNKAQINQAKSAILSGTAGLLFGAGLLK